MLISFKSETGKDRVGWMMGVLAVSAQQRRDLDIFNGAQMIKVPLRKEYVIFVKLGNMEVSFNRAFSLVLCRVIRFSPVWSSVFHYFLTLR